MYLTVRIDMDDIENDQELARIVEDIAQLIRDGETSDICVNRRGSTVGGWEINE